MYSIYMYIYIFQFVFILNFRLAIILCLTVTKCPCHRWSRLYFVVTIPSFPRSWHYRRILNIGSTTTGATNDAEFKSLTYSEHLSSFQFLVRFFLFILFNDMFLVSCCGARYAFRVNTMFDSSWFPFCREFIFNTISI
jgi:hypothetical protein